MASQQPSPRDRLRHPGHDGGHDGSRALYTSSLAILVFLFVLAFSGRQVTSAGTATKLIETGVASLTEIDRVLMEQRPALQETAGTQPAPAYSIPGYPLDVRLTRDEALRAGPAELRSVVLQRSAALVYVNGLDAFDRTGHQALSTFSTQGLLELVTGQLSDGAHSRAVVATYLLAAAVVLVALLVVLRNEGFVRVRALGVGTAGGALPGVVLFLVLKLAVDRVGGNDAFGSGFHEVTGSLLDVFFRNFLVVTVLGVVVAAAGIAFSVAARRFQPWDEDGETYAGYDLDTSAEDVSAS
jgi:hypothetical protein